MPHDDDDSSLRFDFGSNVPNVVNLDSDTDDDSDGTLLEDEFEDRFVRPTPDTAFEAVHEGQEAVHLQDLSSYSSDGKTYKAGKCVELRDGYFLRIVSVLQDGRTGTISLKGIKLARTVLLHGLLEFKMNEIVMMLRSNPADTREIFKQSTNFVKIEDVIRIRELVLTNRHYPALSFREVDPSPMNKDFILAQSRLVCRWEFIVITDNHGVLQPIGEGEVNGLHNTMIRMSKNQKRFNFRGDTVKGGACRRWLPGEKSFDQAERRRCHQKDSPLPNSLNEHEQRYNFGDAFCGAGGASRAAKGAGLRVDWGFDFDPAAIRSYNLNFWKTRSEAAPAHIFATVIKDDFKVDILHLSPPCQPFSPAHTRPGQNDELNEATLFAIMEILKKVKPRVAVLEETFGLTRNIDNLPWFRAMIQMFTKLGFSVRWNVFNLCEFGLPSPRKRLIIFASCPGEVLPEFPEPTHCKAADLHHFPTRSPFITVNDAIARIPFGFPHHNPLAVTKRNDIPYPDNVMLRNTITCNGGPNYHPSGTRAFTLRELACLQGFPLEHQFGNIRVRKQIGNAVPPVVFRTFYEQIKRALRLADGLR